MKMTLQTIMQKMAFYVELVLSAFLLLVVIALSVRLIAQSVPQVWSQQIDRDLPTHCMKNGKNVSLILLATPRFCPTVNIAKCAVRSSATLTICQ